MSPLMKTLPLGKPKLPLSQGRTTMLRKKQDEPSIDEPMPDVDGPMVPIDPRLSDPSTSRKRPLWLKDTLEDAERHISPRGTFRESKKLNMY